jgi:hypothetical protein
MILDGTIPPSPLARPLYDAIYSLYDSTDEVRAMVQAMTPSIYTQDCT